ncbi:MAG: universal stress protein [Chloroflexi bacterium]|nr:universal stress protein [Chloroflexota bacterium]
MSTHGHGGVRRLLLGSVAVRSVRESARPVILVRPREAATVGEPNHRERCGRRGGKAQLFPQPAYQHPGCTHPCFHQHTPGKIVGLKPMQRWSQWCPAARSAGGRSPARRSSRCAHRCPQRRQVSTISSSVSPRCHTGP